MSNITKIWNFSDPNQAREYLNSREIHKDGKVLKVSFVTLESGTDLQFKDMTDDQACHYAAEMAVIWGDRKLEKP